mmetsp:Transcript_5381/g.15702  ORF Transcript_5381/g.15702 Transcript_5381/m.15702 type:complete len:146 (+) Transcript_5381:67-504(+)
MRTSSVLMIDLPAEPTAMPSHNCIRPTSEARKRSDHLGKVMLLLRCELLGAQLVASGHAFIRLGSPAKKRNTPARRKCISVPPLPPCAQLSKKYGWFKACLHTILLSGSYWSILFKRSAALRLPNASNGTTSVMGISLHWGCSGL